MKNIFEEIEEDEFSNDLQQDLKDNLTTFEEAIEEAENVLEEVNEALKKVEDSVFVENLQDRKKGLEDHIERMKDLIENNYDRRRLLDLKVELGNKIRGAKLVLSRVFNNEDDLMNRNPVYYNTQGTLGGGEPKTYGENKNIKNKEENIFENLLRNMGKEDFYER